MKKFGTKIFVFLGLFLTISWLITLYLPYYWGNPWYSAKAIHLESKQGDKPELFFFGSSRVYRQIDPEVFDSTLHALTGSSLNSYNLGAPATFNPHVYYLYRHFLSSPLSDNCRIAFIELMEPDQIGEHLMHQQRVTYWQNYRDISFVLKSIYYNPDINRTHKKLYLKNYLMTYIEKIFHLGHFGDQFLNGEYYRSYYKGTKKNGFFPLEDEVKLTNDKILEENLDKRHTTFLSDTLQLGGRIKMAQQAHNNIEEVYLDTIHLQKIKNLIKISEENNIHLVFLLSPRYVTSGLVKLYSAIPKYHKVDMSDPDVYPHFYQSFYSYDIGHLNTRGAHLYSKEIAVKAANILQNIP